MKNFDARIALDVIADSEAGALPNHVPDEMEGRFFVAWTARLMFEHTPEGTPIGDVFRGFAILAARSPSAAARAFYARHLDTWATEEDDEARDIQAARAYVQHWIRGETPERTVALWRVYVAAASRPSPHGHADSAARLGAELEVLTLPIARRASSHLWAVSPR